MTKKEERLFIFQKTKGRCYYCGVKLQKRWHIEHIEPVLRSLTTGKMTAPDNDNIENKVPSCPRCNNWKHSMSVDSFRYQISNLILGLNRDSSQYRMAKDFNLIEETGNTVQFYFEGKSAVEEKGPLVILNPYERAVMIKALVFVKDHITNNYSEMTAIRDIFQKFRINNANADDEYIITNNEVVSVRKPSK